MTAKPHTIDDEAITAGAVDQGELVAENKALREENNALGDRLVRALADTDNVRRQAERTTLDARQYAISDFARELLTVLDNLQRTVEAAQRHSLASGGNTALLQGVEATQRAFLQILERFGVHPIDAQDRPFDPNFHEAVMEVEDLSRPPGTVVQVLEQGYTINNRLLRPARVAVSKGPGKRPQTRAEPPSEPEHGDLGS